MAAPAVSTRNLECIVNFVAQKVMDPKELSIFLTELGSLFNIELKELESKTCTSMLKEAVVHPSLWAHLVRTCDHKLAGNGAGRQGGITANHISNVDMR